MLKDNKVQGPYYFALFHYYTYRSRISKINSCSREFSKDDPKAINPIAINYAR